MKKEVRCRLSLKAGMGRWAKKKAISPTPVKTGESQNWDREEAGKG